MEVKITVVIPFTEVRSGKTYTAGEVITDPLWHAEDDRKAGAYAARGMVTVEPADDAPAVKVSHKKKQEGK